MFPQLLFVYINSLRTCFDKQEFCFTNDFDISFNENKLNISTKKNPYIGLWGEKISDINLIVGKNGSGKTTLLDLLGSTKNRRMEMLGKSQRDELGKMIFEEWFAVYHIEEDIFVIEGHNPNLIKNLENIPRGTSSEFSICIKYDFKNKKANYLEYIQSKKQGEFSLEKKLVSLYLTNSRDRDWFSGNVIRKEQDIFVGFQRLYLNNPQFSNIYTFLSKGYKGIERGFTAKNAICVLEGKLFFDSFDKWDSDITKLIKLELYKDKDKILLFKNDFLLDILQSGEKNKGEEWTVKEKFTIKLLESTILDLWFNIGKNELNYNLECIKNIDNILFPEDNFEARIKYLLQVLQKIFDALKPEQMMNSTIYSLDFIKECIKILVSINEIYFTSDCILSVNLNGNYDEEIYNLLALYDKYVEYGYQLFHFINIKFKNMSAGELELVSGFANLYTVIQVATHNKQIDTVLLLLDEPDAFFHPEWSRRYIYNICQFLNNNDFGRELKFQILITTHSPFVVSDVPKEHITCINVIEDPSGNLNREVKKAGFGLMSNFYDIIKNDFFITSPIGEYAKYIFKEIVEKISILEKYDEDEIDTLKEIISSIGDDVIRIKLHKLLNEKELELLPKEERIKRRIKELEIELNELKNTQGGESND
ncbi:hypothetical protein CON18_13020 [Bacillus cereus]|uniref:AAA family ATPase n=1 Tax=Bacillus cereus TaxID=1396 RepID=UPI000BEE3FCF|nr:AAA family ATPase [Bacillus cereus]PDZ39783.1 hypothetical protein CON18_13020 [Bacillus cereus]PFA14383.1 hypothetical protein CN377_10845 [Bacillus cereus]PFS81159.1 hypothetical protein COK49_11160 [Bacillus cereus]PGS17374.1 hypothetical protein COC51_05520 [Bacillus cereus]PGV31246.1 hypothetical protein COD93_04205 [Bacillus cereus]